MTLPRGFRCGIRRTKPSGSALSGKMDGSPTPDPPTGYQEPYEAVPVSSWLNYLLGEIALLIGAGVVFGVVAVVVRGSTDVFGVLVQAAGLNPPSAYIVVVAAVGVTLVLHELLHGAFARLYGCDVSFGRRGIGVYTHLQGGFLSRRADAVVTLAPVVVLTIIGLPLLVVDSAVIATAALVGLVVNAAGIGSDLADALALRKLPPGTLLYYGDNGQFVYEPATAA